MGTASPFVACRLARAWVYRLGLAGGKAVVPLGAVEGRGRRRKRVVWRYIHVGREERGREVAGAGEGPPALDVAAACMVEHACFYRICESRKRGVA